MKTKYTITLAGVTMNVISDEAPEIVDGLVSAVDKKIAEICEGFRSCSRSEAALLAALDYCSEKSKAVRKAKMMETKLSQTEIALEDATASLDEANAEIAALREELAKYRPEEEQN